jgi:hypothetical protein
MTRGGGPHLHSIVRRKFSSRDRFDSGTSHGAEDEMPFSFFLRSSSVSVSVPLLCHTLTLALGQLHISLCCVAFTRAASIEVQYLRMQSNNSDSHIDCQLPVVRTQRTGSRSAI